MPRSLLSRPARRRNVPRMSMIHLETLEERALLAVTAGDPDPSWGGSGIVTASPTPPRPLSDTATSFAVAYQGDGKILQGGIATNYTNSSSLAIERINPDGTLDTSFGNGGQVLNPNLGSLNFILPLSSGKMIIGSVVTSSSTRVTRLLSNGSVDTTYGTNGSVETPVAFPGGGASAATDGTVVLGSNGITKITPTGNLDPTFGNGGTLAITVTDLKLLDNGEVLVLSGGLKRLTSTGADDPTFHTTTVSGQGASLAVAPDGSIVVGTSRPSALVPGDLVYRFHADGTPDTTFGTNGVVQMVYTDPNRLSKVLVQPNGGVLVFDTNSAVTRLTTTGSIDTTFGTNGTVALNLVPSGPNIQFWSVATGPAGQVAGTGTLKNASQSFFLTKELDATGHAVASFGSGGQFVSGFSETLPLPSASTQFVRLSDGKYVVGGVSYSSPDINGTATTSLALMRFNANGSVDMTFGTNGVVLMDTGTNSGGIASLLQQSDGKLVVVARNASWLVLRYNADGSLDTTFGAGGEVTSVPGLTGPHPSSGAIQPDGKLVVIGEIFPPGDLAGPGFVARYNQNGTQDTTFNGVGYYQPADIARPYQVQVQRDGAIVVAGIHVITSDVIAVLRLHADGSLDSSFGSSGLALIEPGLGLLAYPVDLALTATGEVVVAIQSQNSGLGFRSLVGAVSRLTKDGKLDPGFGQNGIVIVGDSDRHGVAAYSIYLEPTGRILVGGVQVITVANFDHANGGEIVRLNADGSLDSSFHGALLPAGGIQQMILEPSGRLLTVDASSQSSFTTSAFYDYSSPLVPHRVYRVYNPDPNHPLHHFTTDPAEFQYLTSIGWQDETSAGKVANNLGISIEPNPGTLPLHRLYNLDSGQHYLTTSDGERDALLAAPHGTGQGWSEENAIGYVYGDSSVPGTVQIYRLYNTNNGDHLYLTDANEANGIVAKFPDTWINTTPLGWGYAMSPGTTPTVASLSHVASASTAALSAAMAPRAVRDTSAPASPVPVIAIDERLGQPARSSAAGCTIGPAAADHSLKTVDNSGEGIAPESTDAVFASEVLPALMEAYA